MAIMLVKIIAMVIKKLTRQLIFGRTWLFFENLLQTEVLTMLVKIIANNICHTPFSHYMAIVLVALLLVLMMMMKTMMKMMMMLMRYYRC